MARTLSMVACAALSSGWFAGAQPASFPPAAPPKVLLLVRQQFKPAKSRAYERLLRAVAAAYNRLEVPLYFIALQAFTGPPEALFFDPFDSFEAVEKAAKELGPLNEMHPELVQLQSGIDGSLSSQSSILAVRRDSPGVNGINLAHARFLRMIVVRTPPGAGEPDAAGLPSPLEYEVKSGMAGPAFLIFQTMTDFAEVPAAHISSGTIVEDSVYAVQPEISHVSRAFAEQDQALWTKPPPSQ